MKMIFGFSASKLWGVTIKRPRMDKDKYKNRRRIVVLTATGQGSLNDSI
jgi:hypothetical protein